MADNKNAAAVLVCETQEALYEKAVKKMKADHLIVQFAYKIENYETAAAMFEEVGDYADALQLAQRCRELAEETRKAERKDRYQRAQESQNSAVTELEYERVAEAFQELGDYQDAAQKRQQCLDLVSKIRTKRKRKIGIAVMILVILAGTVTAGFATGFFRYLKGIGYYYMEFYDKAELAFEKTPGLLDSDQWAERCRQQIQEQDLETEKEDLKKAKEGDRVSFGSNTWRVLERQGDEILLILDEVKKDSVFYHVPYDENGGTVTWESSSLRKKLNSEFVEKEFTVQEQESLLPVLENNNDEAQLAKNGADGQTSSKIEKSEYTGSDRMRILSLEEAERYQEILKQMSGVDFWLSTQGSQDGTAAFITGGGAVIDYGCPVDCSEICVRPVIRIDCVEAAEEETK